MPFWTCKNNLHYRSLVGQAPIGIACMGLAYYQLPVSMREVDLQSAVSLWEFDWAGIVAFFFAVTSFVLGTTDGGTFLSSVSKPSFLVASCVFLIVFVIIERFSAKNPIIPPSVVSSPRLSNIFLGQILYFSSISTVRSPLPFARRLNLIDGYRSWTTYQGTWLRSIIFPTPPLRSRLGSVDLAWFSALL